MGTPAEVLALANELGCLFAAIFLDLLQALILSLRIADGFGQYLAELRLRLRRFATWGLPLGHETYVGLPERKLNPVHIASGKREAAPVQR